jgi:UDP-N-acetylmuramoyl-tripeptide--D-alanyl-D-alanine ligase
MKLTVREVAAALGLGQAASGKEVTGWSIDTRTLAHGDLFVALRGPNHDGHAYLEAAFARGAVAAVVDHIPADAKPEWTLLVVADTQKALEEMGRYARSRFAGTVIGLTGSAGKTTSKEVVAALLATRLAVGKNTGNLNNHIGVPLSLLRLPGEAQVAVLEMGMNHAGEIAHLTSMARPSIGVVTNAGYAHIENFESVEGVAAAKRELIEGLPEDGVAVLNADDAQVRRFGEGRKVRVVTFGLSEGATVRGEDVEFVKDGARFTVGGVRLETRLMGRHGVSNILCGLAVAGLFGIGPAEAREAVALLEPGERRGRLLERNGIVHIDDSYNSNPDAARAMVDLLVDTPAQRRIAVIGEMLELGDWSERLHRDLGRYAAGSGIDVLVGIRGAAKHAVEAALEADIANSAAYFFATTVEAGEWLKGQARAGDAILWKGSRGTRVEDALERFLQ